MTQEEPHHRPVRPTERHNARRMRQVATDAEAKLWRLLRNRRLRGSKFRRQALIGRYIVDFVCLDRRLIVEADGGQHAEKPADAVRDAWFLAQGFRIVRYWNNDILMNPEGMLSDLEEKLGQFRFRTDGAVDR